MTMTLMLSKGKGDMKLKIGLPKGSLQDSTLSLLDKAGFSFSIRERSYFPASDDEELEAILIRAQEMARYVYDGVLDAGITGKDWIMENGVDEDVVEVAELVYSKVSVRPVRWVVAVPESSPIQSVKDLEGKRIATKENCNRGCKYNQTIFGEPWRECRGGILMGSD